MIYKDTQPQDGISLDSSVEEITETVASRVIPILNMVQEMIASMPNGEMPSGHLYAMLMGYMDLSTYNSMIELMIKSGGITKSGHMLKAK